MMRIANLVLFLVLAITALIGSVSADAQLVGGQPWVRSGEDKMMEKPQTRRMELDEVELRGNKPDDGKGDKHAKEAGTSHGHNDNHAEEDRHKKVDKHAEQPPSSSHEKESMKNVEKSAGDGHENSHRGKKDGEHAHEAGHSGAALNEEEHRGTPSSPRGNGPVKNDEHAPGHAASPHADGNSPVHPPNPPISPSNSLREGRPMPHLIPQRVDFHQKSMHSRWGRPIYLLKERFTKIFIKFLEWAKRMKKKWLSKRESKENKSPSVRGGSVKNDADPSNVEPHPVKHDSKNENEPSSDHTNENHREPVKDVHKDTEKNEHAAHKDTDTKNNKNGKDEKEDGNDTKSSNGKEGKEEKKEDPNKVKTA